MFILTDLPIFLFCQDPSLSYLHEFLVSTLQPYLSQLAQTRAGLNVVRKILGQASSESLFDPWPIRFWRICLCHHYLFTLSIKMFVCLGWIEILYLPVSLFLCSLHVFSSANIICEIVQEISICVRIKLIVWLVNL